MCSTSFAAIHIIWITKSQPFGECGKPQDLSFGWNALVWVSASHSKNFGKAWGFKALFGSVCGDLIRRAHEKEAQNSDENSWERFDELYTAIFGHCLEAFVWLRKRFSERIVRHSQLWQNVFGSCGIWCPRKRKVLMPKSLGNVQMGIRCCRITKLSLVKGLRFSHLHWSLNNKAIFWASSKILENTCTLC